MDLKGEINNYIYSTGSLWMPESKLHSHIGEANKDSDIVCCRNMYTLKSIAEVEDSAAYNLFRLLQCKQQQVPESVIDSCITKFERDKYNGHSLHLMQVNGVKMVVNNSLSVLTGGPGTGKTTVLSAISYTMRQLYPDITISYTSPTGKAARRITESTGEKAVTLYSKIGLFNTMAKSIDFVEDLLFIDESSMSDIFLVNKLVLALRNRKRIVFVGDPDQLPSVGPGAVLRDMIRSNTIPVTMLTHTFRQDNNSTLLENIDKVRAGDPNLVEGPDFHPIKVSPGEDISEKMVQSYLSENNKYEKGNVGLLLPYRRKGLCSNKMNVLLQQKLNREKKGYVFTDNDGFTFGIKKGDLVMQLVNRSECVNGETGEAVEVSAKGVTVAYNDLTVDYSQKDLKQLSLAYAMSVHKSQGSEYPSVIMALTKEHTHMLVKNIIYTGITRAKKNVILYYEPEALEIALKTIADDKRITLLSEKLQYLYQQGA